MIQKSFDALVIVGRMGELLEPRPQHSAKLEQGRESMFQDAERCRDLVRAAPGEVQRNLPTCHRGTPIVEGPSLYISCLDPFTRHQADPTPRSTAIRSPCRLMRRLGDTEPRTAGTEIN